MKKKRVNEKKLLYKDFVDGYAYYKGFKIKECTNQFGNIYYTIINTRIGSHVHANSLSATAKIIDTAVFVLKNPFYIPQVGRSNNRNITALYVFEKAYRLAFREKGKQNVNRI